MPTRKQILDLYFNKHLKQKEIAKLTDVSNQYVSKVVNHDKRYSFEKSQRKVQSAKRNKEYMKNYFKTYKRKKTKDNSYEQLKAQLAQDSQELSYSPNVMSDYSFAKWNSSAYHRNKKGNLVLNRNVNAGFTAPKSVNMNIKVPTQKYKHI